MEGFIYDINLIKGLNQANNLPAPVFTYMIEEILKYICEEDNSLEISHFYDICVKEEITSITSEQQLSTTINSFIYLLRFYFKKEVSPAQITTFLKENTLLAEDLNLKIKELLETKEKKLTNFPRLSKLKDLKWSIRSQLCNEQYPNISKLYVLLEFVVQEVNGTTKNEVISLTLTEFKIFMNQIKEIQEISQGY